MQELVLGSQRATESVFANELLEIYKFIKDMCREEKLDDIKGCLPKSARFYQDEINFLEFESPPITPVKKSNIYKEEEEEVENFLFQNVQESRLEDFQPSPNDQHHTYNTFDQNDDDMPVYGFKPEE